MLIQLWGLERRTSVNIGHGDITYTLFVDCFFCWGTGDGSSTY